MRTQNIVIIGILFVCFIAAESWHRGTPTPKIPTTQEVVVASPRFVFPASSASESHGGDSASFATSSATLDTAPSSTPSLHARIAYLSDLLDFHDVYASSISARWPLASISKLMTAVVLLRHHAMNDIVVVPRDAFALSRDEVDKVALEAGESYRVRDLLAMMLLPSSNRAADAASVLTGSRENFIAEMNAQAISWDMRDTFFNEPTGLSVLNQSTASDLKKMAFHIYAEYPEIFTLTREPRHEVKELSSGRVFSVESINQFAGTDSFIGGKTGYTDDANGNLLTLFSYNGKPYIIVVMGTTSRFDDTQKLMHWLKSTSIGG